MKIGPSLGPLLQRSISSGNQGYRCHGSFFVITHPPTLYHLLYHFVGTINPIAILSVLLLCVHSINHVATHRLCSSAVLLFNFLSASRVDCLVFAFSKKIKKHVKERAKKEEKREKERRFERLQGVVLRICYQKFPLHILSWC
jgi:hypothetical protein